MVQLHVALGKQMTSSNDKTAPVSESILSLEKKKGVLFLKNKFFEMSFL